MTAKKRPSINISVKKRRNWKFRTHGLNLDNNASQWLKSCCCCSGCEWRGVPNESSKHFESVCQSWRRKNPFKKEGSNINRFLRSLLLGCRQCWDEDSGPSLSVLDVATKMFCLCIFLMLELHFFCNAVIRGLFLPNVREKKGIGGL